ncbi:AI-2E family transporter [Nitrosomonas communis]|uniref:AI-2E family transporter n=1 Tax=Nitrosomonas communis TaxID=44574 RepID=UPI003D2B6051
MPGEKALMYAGAFALVSILMVLLWKAGEVFLLIFAGVLLAVFLNSLSKWIHQKMHLSEKWSLAFVLLVLSFVTAIGIWSIAPEVSDQIDRLTEYIPQAVDQARQQILKYEWMRKLLEKKDQIASMASDGSNITSTIAGMFSSTFGALANFLVFLVIGIFLAINPRIYLNGIIRLVPQNRRTRAREILHEVGSALQSWLLAKIIAMFVVGILTAIGLSLIGIELALLLGIIAALLTFIPNIGPILALIPAALLALMHGSDNLIYVIALYMGVQVLESYVLTPLLQQDMVDLPPALIISMQILLGVLAGGLGIILATPMTAASMVLIRMIYIEDILGDRQSEAGP